LKFCGKVSGSVIVAGTVSGSFELIGCARLGDRRGVSFAGATSDDVDHEREKLSAGSGSAAIGRGLDFVAAPLGGAAVFRNV